MNLDELLLNSKAVSFDSLISQKDILTAEDKDKYSQKGYFIPFTTDEFKEKFDIDPNCVWYTPSISCSSLYFNPDTLAAVPLHLNLYLSGIGPGTDVIYKQIKEIEEQVSKHDYFRAIMSLPDAMQLEYFNKLIEKKGSDIPDLYELFFTFYISSDYGFSSIKDNTLKAILNAKTEEENIKTAATIESLPDIIKIYRGGNSVSTAYNEAYSWTLDINTAMFFACRRGQAKGYIAEAEIKKENIIEAFLDERGEQEIIIDPSKLMHVQEHPVYGIEFLEEALPKSAPMYHKFLDQLMSLEFAQDSEEHGYAHEARVMLLALIIGEAMGLPARDQRILATAAIYHDLQRVNDIDDIDHGAAGKDYYHTTVSNPDPLVEFLCEYHCLPDEKGQEEIRNNRKLSKNRSRAKLLYDIFKDADALDRCRFGLHELDVNYLRTPISKKLPLAAKLCYENVKIPEINKEVAQNNVSNKESFIKEPLDNVISAAEGKVISVSDLDIKTKDYGR